MSARPATVRAPARAFAYAFALGAREAWRQRGALAGVFLTYSVILSIWASLYRLLSAATLARVSLSYVEVVWYLALTELVAFSVGHAYRQIQDEVTGGGLGAQLVRPVGYIALTSAQELGQVAAKIALLALPGAALAFALTGAVPFGLSAVPPLALSLLAGAGVLLAAHVLIGLSTAWLGTARPVFFIVQKLVFVLGGLVVPIEAYPAPLARLARWTPFPAMLAAPASLALDSRLAPVAVTLGTQGVWVAAAWLAVAGTARAFERRLVREGVL